MGAYSPVFASISASQHLRPIDPRRDLLEIADLIELCFKDTLDPDSYQYLRQMRNLARRNALLTLAYNLAESAAQNPVRGFVWEQDGRIVGNASLLPVQTAGGQFFLLANVAVHPDFRGQGIGRALTSAAVTHGRKGGHPIWLQVREQNDPAVHIYRASGFRERARRTTWRANPGMPHRPLAIGTSVQPRQNSHWSTQVDWLSRLYPPELRWHLSIDRRLLSPGLMGFLHRLMSFESVRQWSVLSEGKLAGVLSWRETSRYVQNLWLAAPAEADETALVELLCAFRWQISRRMQPALTLECPSDFAVSALTEAGFYAHQTLIWMDLPAEKQP